jgi:hypothetical protein
MEDDWKRAEAEKWLAFAISHRLVVPESVEKTFLQYGLDTTQLLVQRPIPNG